MSTTLPPPSTTHHHWTATLAAWQAKQTTYQTALATTTDPDQQQSLQLGLDTCQDMIQTCQDLLQILPPSPEPITAAIVPHLPAAPPAQPPALEPQHPQRLWQVLFPCLLIALAFFSSFRPRNVCKIAPDNRYHPDGLALWVEQTIHAKFPQTLQTVYVAQTGCTVQLKGQVPSHALRNALIILTQNLEVPSQSMVDRFMAQFQLQAPRQIKPVQKVIADLTISPD